MALVINDDGFREPTAPVLASDRPEAVDPGPGALLPSPGSGLVDFRPTLLPPR